MASELEINALRRLLDSVNRLAASNAASLGKLVAEQQVIRQELLVTRASANRALQLINELRAEIGKKP